jgi:hypothetical protein
MVSSGIGLQWLFGMGGIEAVRAKLGNRPDTFAGLPAIG